MHAVDPVTEMVIIVAALLLLGRAGEYVFSRTGVPDMVWMVLAGIVAGPVFKLVPLEVLSTALPFFGAVALIVILGGGGMRLQIKEVAQAAPRGAVLAIVGFVFSMAATCIFGQVMSAFDVFPRLTLAHWIMIGAILGGSSSLVIMPAMSAGGVAGPMARLLEVESCITDSLCVIVSMVVIQMLAGSAVGSNPAWDLFKQVGIGFLAGGVGALVMLPALDKLAGRPDQYTVLLSGLLVLYAVVYLAGGNGSLGVLTCALVLGNSNMIFRRKKSWDSKPSFSDDPATWVAHDQLTFLVKSDFFFVIGVMFPTSPRLIFAGAGLAVVLTLFRFPATAVSLWKSGFKRGEMRLISVCMPRGLAAGVMSTVPMQVGIKGMEELTPGIFSTIVFTILIFAAAFAVFNKGAAGDRTAPAGCGHGDGREEGGVASL